jgi:hypothetical protein
MTELTIHHFEDQPENMSWIPGTLLNAYWAAHPEWIKGDGNYQAKEDGSIVSFQLHPTLDESVTIRYRVYDSKGVFEDLYEPLRGDIVLLDVMREQPTGGFEPEGLDQLRDLLKRDEGVAIYVVTAYPGKIPKEMYERLNRRVFTKPMDIDAFIAELISTLKVEQHGNKKTSNEP